VDVSLVDPPLLLIAQTKALRISQQLCGFTLVRCYNLSVCCAASLLATAAKLGKSF
jgi:hypothetical protein